MTTARSNRTFIIEWPIEVTLTVDEIWPDGDAPENPTAADVIEVMKGSGTRRHMVTDWGLDHGVPVTVYCTDPGIAKQDKQADW